MRGPIGQQPFRTHFGSSTVFFLLVGLLPPYAAGREMSLGNPFAPHQGSRFEEWYLRLTDSSQNLSVGMLLGHTTSSQAQKTSQAYACLLFPEVSADQQPGAAISANISADLLPPVAMEEYPAGLSVQSYSDASHATNFAVACQFPNMSLACDLFAIEGHVLFSLTTAEVDILVRTTGNALPWPTQRGPEGLASLLPLPMHWYVYTMGTPAEYLITDKRAAPSATATGARTRAGVGLLHMDSKQGTGISAAWIWAQGSSISNGQEAHFALVGRHLSRWWPWAGGPMVWLLGCRLQQHALALTPWNALFRTQIDGCKGRFTISATQITRRVELTLQAASSSFVGLAAPNGTIFEPNLAHDSYSASGTLKILKRQWLWRAAWQEAVVHHIHGAALEFGGQFACKPESY